MNRKHCCVFGCAKTNASNPELKFSPLPTDTARQQEWLKVIGRPDLLLQAHTHPKTFYVCSSHFEDEDMTSTSLLYAGALPCRHLPGKSFNDTTRGNRTEKSSIIGENVNLVSPAKENWKVLQIKDDKQPQIEVPLGLQDELTRNMLKLKQTIVNKERNSKDFLFYALNLYLLNPQIYLFIREALNLPNKRVLQNVKFKISPKLDKRVLVCLSSKLKSFPDKAKYCTVCIETMNVKNNVYYDILNDELVGVQEIDGIKSDEVAGMAYVVMLRSILVNWDQPVTYCFLAGVKNIAQLQSWIDGIIASLLEIGFEVMALVTNQGSSFKKYVTDVKHITPKEHYFVVNNRKIYYIFEFPHLFNDIRNNFGTKDIIYNEKKISWQYLESLYQLEMKKPHKIIPKITAGHIGLYRFTKMPSVSVKFAAETFSSSVSTAIHAYADMKEMPEEARDTADFCLFLNNLFDVLNSTTYKSDHIFKCALGSHESQMKVLREALNVFSDTQWNLSGKSVIGRKTQPNPRAVFSNVLVTINSVISIAQDLNMLGHKRILTERLNSEPLEKFLDLLRPSPSKTKERTNSSSIQVCRKFSKQFLKHTLTKSPLSNSPSAFQQYFKNVSEFETDIMNTNSSNSLILLGQGETDYRLQLPEDHPTIYVASYIFYKCQQAHRCDALDNYASTLPDLANTRVYDAYNRNAPFYGKLKLLDYKFIRYIEQLELAFTQVFNKGVSSTPGSQAFSNLRYIPFLDPPCKCFPQIYAVKLLIRLRIYATMKTYNKLIKQRNMNFCEFFSALNKELQLIK